MDTITLVYNEKEILTDVVATSETEYGFSRIRIEFFEDQNGEYTMKSLASSKWETKEIAALPKDSITFVLKMNTFSREIVSDTIKLALSKGKFIGISKIDFEQDTFLHSIKSIPSKIEIWQGHKRILFQ